MAQNESLRKLGTNELTVSLTSFTDFVLQSGLKKLAVAQSILEQHCSGYKPGRDYYRRFRDATIKVHASGIGVASLNDVVDGTSLESQRINYAHLLRGYQRFWASHFQEYQPAWVPPTRLKWSTGHLAVRVNPELGFNRDGERHIIKMYMKQQEPTLEQLQVILHLMQIVCLRSGISSVVSVLDVRRGRLFQATTFDRRYDPLLRGEALSLVGMCRSLEAEELETKPPEDSSGS